MGRDHRRDNYDGRQENFCGNNLSLEEMLAPLRNQSLQPVLNDFNSLPPPPPAVMTSISSMGGEIMKSIKKSATISINLPEGIASGLERSGNSLNDVRRFSGCDVDLRRADGPSRKLTLHGSLEQAQVAYILIAERVEALGAPTTRY